jgi:aconitate hydratase
MYLGVRIVVAKSFERIHSGNLVNFGILPLVFINPRHYNRISQGDSFRISGLIETVRNGEDPVIETENGSFELKLLATERQRKILLAGGLLNFTRDNMKGR